MSANAIKSSSQIKPSDPDRHQWISVAAYFKAEHRGFKSGKELDDWLEAEIEYTQFLVKRFLLQCEEDGEGGMPIIQLQHLAFVVGVTNAGQINSEEELVHLIQRAYHHRECFRSEKDTPCGEPQCPWQTECHKLIAHWLR